MTKQQPFFTLYEVQHDDWLYEYPAIGLNSAGYSGWNFNEGEIDLWADGCWVDGIRNCTKMCTNTTAIWGSTPVLNLSVVANVANCAIYPVLANMIESEMHNLSDPDHLIESFGIKSASLVDLHAINTTAGSCLTSYCAARGSKCGPLESYAEYDFDNFEGSWFNFRSDNLNIIVPDYASLCYGVDIKLNNDIGGIGVVIAYLLTASILMLLYTAIRLSKNVVQYFAVLYHKVRTNPSSRNWQMARAKSLRVQRQVYKSPHTFNLISTIAEFQKGQCIFWIAISVAVLIGLAGARQTIDSATIADFNNNITVLQVVCSCAFFYTSLGQYCVWIVRKRSIYILLLSIMAMILSGSGWVATKYAKANDNINIDDDTTQFNDCGMINPVSYCDQGIGTDGSLWNGLHSNYIDTVSVSLGICCVIAIAVDMVLHKSRFRKLKIARTLCTCDRRPLPRWRNVLVPTLLFLFEGTFIAIWYFTFIWYISLARIADIKAWGFGQVIAVSVWAPILLEYIHGNFVGVEKVLEYRVPEGYRLVKNREKQLYSREDVEFTTPKMQRDVEQDLEFTATGYGNPRNTAYTPVEGQSREESRRYIHIDQI